MRGIVRLLVGVGLTAVLLVAAHVALTRAVHVQGPVGRHAAGTCAACH